MGGSHGTRREPTQKGQKPAREIKPRIIILWGDSVNQHATHNMGLLFNLLSTPIPNFFLTPCVSLPVNYPLTVQVLKATANLSSVEDGPLLIKAWVPHVVNVKL